VRPVIKVRNISKRYTIGAGRGGSSFTLREEIMAGLEKICQRGKHDAPQKHDFWALKDVSFDIYPGDIVGVIGGNGAGKSTLLKILSRIVEPSEGYAEIYGKVGSLLEVGTGFHPELTGRENIYLNGAIIGMKHAEIYRKFDEIVEFAEITEFLDVPVKHYSSGMYLRLGFAVAAHLEADVLIVDEALAVGDANFQQKCIKKMEQSKSNGKTIILVSHNMGVVASLCNRTILLEKGQLVPDSSVVGAITRYLRSGQKSDAEWSGDVGNENVRLLRVALEKQAGNEVCIRGDMLQLLMEYQIYKENRNLLIGIEVYNSLNQLLCANRLTDYYKDDLDLVQKAGRHSVLLNIDTSIFADGDYHLKFDFGIHNIARIIEDDPVICFRVVDNLINTYHDSVFRRNMIYPSWKWEVQQSD
jgi:lipopolysaccharide transport system ATP-binding protein